MIEQTMILLKPDAVARGLVGEITTRFEKAGFKIVGMKMVHIDEEMAKKHYSAKILKFKQEKINNISITSIMPSLSKQQYVAFNLAVNNGYYEFPKLITLDDLARLMKISYSTYQEHLKRAESKLLPSLIK